VPGRAAVLILALALPACRAGGTDDGESAPSPSGIPMGAVGAVGAGYDAPVSSGATVPVPKKKGTGILPLVPDPFASPPPTSGDAGAPARPRPSRGTPL
jgi:hypothetical protein